jgi:hypothetical protein
MANQPLAIDFYSRYFAKFFDEKQYIKEHVAGQAFFGRPETNSYTIFAPSSEAIDIDIMRGDEKIAPLIPRGSVGRFVGPGHLDVQVGQTSTFSRVFPLIEIQENIGAGQLNKRLPGEGIYEALDKTARLRELARRGYMEMDRKIIRLQEVLAWQSLLLGVQSIVSASDTTNQIYDWRRNASNTPSLTHGWGNAAGVPLTDIDALYDQTMFAGKLLPDFMVWGKLAMRYFMANQQVSTNYANKLYFNMLDMSGKHDPGPQFARFVAAGLIPMGTMRTPSGYELEIFTYPYVYNSGGAATKYFDDTKVLMGSTSARADRFFGPAEKIDMDSIQIQQLMERFGFNALSPPLPEGIIDPGNTILPQQFYVDSFLADQNKNVTLRVQAAPIFAPTMTDAWGVMQPGVTS